MDGKDRISELPNDILDHILGLLAVEDAAKTAVLSTSLRDAWLNLTHLNFDSKFFNYFQNRYITGSTTLVIDKILKKHIGPIRKFVFDFYFRRYKAASRWFEFDEWLLFVTQNGVEEIYLSFGHESAYILPDCIFSCLTLKTLHLSGVFLEPINAPCIFPNVTSLCFEHVKVDSRNHFDFTADLPMFKSLPCDNISCFTAPKLSTLRIRNLFGILRVNLDLRPVRSLHLGGSALSKVFVEELTRTGQEQVTLNVEHLRLSFYYLDDGDEIYAFFYLLRMCPKLWKLDICLSGYYFNMISEQDFPEAQTFKSIRALNIFYCFEGSMSEMLLFKWLLSCFPSLEKVVIFRKKSFLLRRDFEWEEKLLCFLGASTEVEIVYYNEKDDNLDQITPFV